MSSRCAFMRHGERLHVIDPVRDGHGGPGAAAVVIGPAGRPQRLQRLFRVQEGIAADAPPPDAAGVGLADGREHVLLPAAPRPEFAVAEVFPLLHGRREAMLFRNPVLGADDRGES